MNTNRFMLYNDFIYALYTEEDEQTRHKELLSYLRMLIPGSYASLLTCDPDSDETSFTGVYCDPVSFTAAEERYAKMYTEDQMQWNLHSKVSTVLKALVRHINYAYSHAASKKAAGSTVDLKSIPEDVHLTAREEQIMDLVFRALPNHEICEELHITDHTLQKHFQNIYRKLNISSRIELFRYRRNP